MDFSRQHLLGIMDLNPLEIEIILDRAGHYAENPRPADRPYPQRNQVNMFFENSTRTQSSFEIAGVRLGLDVLNMSLQSSSIKKGETLIDTAQTLNAMQPDILVVRHFGAGAVSLLANKVDCAVINAGDGRHEHPTQALLDALTIRRRLGRLSGLNIAICGDIAHSRVARSNILLLQKLGNQVRLVGPNTLVPTAFSQLGCTIHNDMREGLKDADVVMVLRLQKERMKGAFVPSEREFFHYWGVDEEKLGMAREGAILMHPGPMNRGVEIDGELADDITRSTVQEQVAMGVAVRMAIIDLLLTARRGAR